VASTSVFARSSRSSGAISLGVPSPIVSSGDLSLDLHTVLGDLQAAGHGDVYRIDLTNPRFGIPVVKMFVPGMVHFSMHS